MRRITFYTRANCHLCDSARYVLERTLAGRTDVSVQFVSIDDDPATRARYNNHIPVIMLDGAEIARHRLDANVLISALNSPPA
jgi:glutaredoxin